MEEDYPTDNTTRGSFLYRVAPPPPPSVKVAPIHNLLEMNNFQPIQSNHSFLSPHHQVKSEASAAAASSSQHAHKQFYYSLLSASTGDHQQQPTLDHFLQQQQQQQQRQHEQEEDGERTHDNNKRLLLSDVDSMKAKIISHPQYSNLLEAYMDCQKVGAPEEVVIRLTAVQREFETHRKATMSSTSGHRDPELDQFMEAYCDMLVKYREELTRPLQEAMDFFRKVETQLKAISNNPITTFTDEKRDGVGSSEDDQDDSKGATQLPEIDPRAEDKELKDHLLKRYSGCLSRLKQELSKKKKKGKLPKEARQKLLNWWELHYKWPYPSETEKVALAESTGLDQKQINNWFINQRKRHWKPSEDPQFVVMDGPIQHPPNTVLYMDGHFMADGTYRLVP